LILQVFEVLVAHVAFVIEFVAHVLAAELHEVNHFQITV
jgi:hypothetical protein